MGTIVMPCEPGQVSDGYHTFDELYDHRCTLFLALMKAHPAMAWVSDKHDDGTMFPGWFVAGMHLPSGDVSYHLPQRLWALATSTGAVCLSQAPKFDGHTSADVVNRLLAWVGG